MVSRLSPIERAVPLMLETQNPQGARVTYSVPDCPAKSPALIAWEKASPFSVLDEERKRPFNGRIPASEARADEALVAELESSGHINSCFGLDCVQSREDFARALCAYCGRVFRRHSETLCESDSSHVDRHTPAERARRVIYEYYGMAA